MSAFDVSAKGKRKGESVGDPDAFVASSGDLVFEDPYGDDIIEESEDEEEGGEEVLGEEVEKEGDDATENMEMETAVSPGKTQPKRATVYRPAEGEELEFDPSAYVMYHAMSTEWPCLSFDILRDNHGEGRNRFPLTMFLACGSQAERADRNCVTLLKLTDLNKTQEKGSDDEDSDDDNDDNNSDDDLDDDPVMQHTNIPHRGGVNRIRSMPQSPGVIATLSDTSNVHIFDATKVYGTMQQKAGLTVAPQTKLSPCFTMKDHREEGFAIDWSPVTAGRLLTGDCAGVIRLTSGAAGSGGGGFGGWRVDSNKFMGHSGSVEDIQWSPSESSVFSSASSDCTVKIWDTRGKTGPQLSIDAHTADVNVISWNRNVTYLMASGSDDGSFKVWDLRALSKNEPLAHFKYHTAPITSIEFAQHDESLITVSSEDDQVSIWDLSVEAETDAEDVGDDQQEFPPQLLFIHQGQRNVKEVHFHPQIPGLLVSTAEDGFNVFKPAINVSS